LITLGQFLAFFFAALIPSIMGAISGIGGGIIIKPMLDTFFGLRPEEINFLSGSTVLAMSIITLLQNRIRKIKLNDRRGIVLALGAVFGGVTGKLIFTVAISVSTGKSTGIIQSGILIFLCAAVLFYMMNKHNIKSVNIISAVPCFFLGLLMGIISAFLGIGGGPINLMILTYFLGLNSKTASLYSIYAICLSQMASLISSIIAGSIPAVPAAILIVMVSGGVIGGLMGSGIYQDMSNRQVDIFFRVILAAVIALSLFHLIRTAV